MTGDYFDWELKKHKEFTQGFLWLLAQQLLISKGDTSLVLRSFIDCGEKGLTHNISSFDGALTPQLALNGIKNDAYKSTAYVVLYIILRMANIYKIIGVNGLSVYV